MNTSDDSGFEEDLANNLLLDPVKSNSSSPSTPPPDSQKTEIIPFIPLVQSGISLEPDMLFGWKPKNLTNSGPIPINFSMESIPTKGCIYYGFRPEDSLELHESFSSPTSYPFTIDATVKQAYKIIQKKTAKKDGRPFIGMKSQLEEEILVFNSKFESGNLDKVVKVNENEYDLFIRNDSNSYGKNQWFYFEVRNSLAEREVKFNVVNFCKHDSLYTQGQQPLVFRTGMAELGWHYFCSSVKYGFSKVNKTLENRRTYYCLSFKFSFPGNETLKFAYSLPYTYSDLLKFLSGLETEKCVKQEVLCKSLSGIDVPLLTITDFESGNKKECILATARVHPGETHGSWMMQGFISFLLSNSPSAIHLRHLCVFKIIPMLNPDGVILGNARCSLNGQDLNRQFQSPDSRLHPEICSLKALIKSSKEILTYLDCHSHSKKKGVFIYGPYFPLHSEFHCKIRVIPKLLSENTEFFRYYSCKFRNDWSKRKAARLVIAKEQSLVYCYTIEASAFGYFNSERVTVPFDLKNLQEMGQHILITILQFIELRNEEILQKEVRAEMRKRFKGSVKEEHKRTMEDILNMIKKDLQNEDESDSGGSNSDSDNEQEEEKVNKRILSVLKQVNTLLVNPENVTRYCKSQAPKMVKVAKKSEDLEVQAKSTLAKYFSRASTDNRSKFKYRAESTKRSSEVEKKAMVKMGPKQKETISKFSYSRGLYALKRRNHQMIFEKTVLKNKKPAIRLENKMQGNINLGVFLDGIDSAFESNSEGESTRNQLDISIIMKKNRKYHSTERIN